MKIWKHADFATYLDATSLIDITVSIDVGVKISKITKLVAEVVDEVGDILGDVTTVTSDITDGAVDTVSGTVGSLKTRQIVDVASIVDLKKAVKLVFTEISATLESVTAVIEIRKSNKHLEGSLSTNRLVSHRDPLGPWPHHPLFDVHPRCRH